MTDLVLPPGVSLPAMSAPDIDLVRDFEKANAERPQVDLEMDHLIHGGMYARTVYVPAGVAFTGALIKVATTVIISGDVTVYIGEEAVRLTGHFVLPAEANRKQAFATLADTIITMIFPTDAKTVEECEAEFTDETDLLASRKSENNHVLITR